MRLWPLLLVLAGCATSPEVVKVQVPVPCIRAEDVPPRPEFVSDAALARMDDADLVLSLRIDQLAARGYADRLEAIVRSCR